MRNVYLLNIEHDLALANNTDNYIAPRVAVEMNRDFSILPLWYAEKGSTIVREGHISEELIKSLDIRQKFVTKANFESYEDDNYHVWGWDRNIAWKIRKINKNARIPNLEKIRELSHRSISIKILKELAEKGLFEPLLVPVEISDLKEVKRLTEAQKWILKAPLSGSGRGLWWALNGYDFNVQRWSNRTINTQGSLIAEPIWEKRQDYAMEFKCQNGECQFAGYSLFDADPAGVYRCNILLPDHTIEERLCNEIGTDYLMQVKQALTNIIAEEIAPYYEGYLGVDMLTGNYNGKIILNPCVEVNLRMTMGIIARIFYDRYINEQSTGDFKTMHFKGNGELIDYVNEQTSAHPLNIQNGKIANGFMPLTSVTKESKYLICVEVKEKA